MSAMKSKKAPLQRILSLLVAFLLASVSFHVMAQAKSKTWHEDKESLRKALKSWDTSEIKTSDRYIAAFRDINGDGKVEAIVYFIGPDWCGTGGCVMLVLTKSGSSWKVISDTATTQLPIRVLSRTSHGWHSIGVWVQGGGIYPGYEAELRFNGKTYPSGPSVPPAIRVHGVAGNVLIPNDEKSAEPLYMPMSATTR